MIRLDKACELAILMFTLLVTTSAYATMPRLTPEPKPATPTTCKEWAAKQDNAPDNDALEMWGIQENGISSRDVALRRLFLYCLGQSPPEIVGFGSSVGFNEAYCEKHPTTKLCKDYKRRQSGVDGMPAEPVSRVAAFRLYLIWEDSGQMSQDLSQRRQQIIANDRRLGASVQARVDIVLEGAKIVSVKDSLEVSVHTDAGDTTYSLPVGYFTSSRLLRSIIVTHDCNPFEVNAVLGKPHSALKVDLTCGD
jgi:hypothetical protein